MDASYSGPSTISGPPKSQTSFLRALNAPFVAVPPFSTEPQALMLTVEPQVPQCLELAWPLCNSTGGLEPLSDIRDLATLHDNELHTTTIRTCRVGDRTLEYLNKSWKIASRDPGVLSELYLYNNPLKHFMGEHVPNLISVRSAPGRLDLGFELPNQTFFIEPSADMPDALKRRTIKTVEKLHAHGVCHNALKLDDIMIGADGQIYIYNFHHARYIKENPAVFLLEANETDFALELRRLKFKLDYENARAKEKTKLSNVVNRERKNDIELRQARTDPFYCPQYIQPSRDEQLNPPLDLSTVNSWFSDLGREPKRFIMPGQRAEDFERALEGFYNILRLMEHEDNDLLMTETQQSMTLKRRRSKESEECSPSRKRVRQSSGHPHPYNDEAEANLTKPNAFKHDDQRSQVIGLVSSREVQPSIQENNLISEWPMVVVRDFAKEPLPKIGDRLKALDKSLRLKAIKEQERDEKGCKVAKESAGPALGPLPHVLQHYLGHDTHVPLSRHETLLFEQQNPIPMTPTLVLCPSKWYPRPFRSKRGHGEASQEPNSSTRTSSLVPSMSTWPSSVHPKPFRTERGCWHR